VGAYILGPRPWGRINTLCSHLKTRFKGDIWTKHAKKRCNIKKKITEEHSSGAQILEAH